MSRGILVVEMPDRDLQSKIDTRALELASKVDKHVTLLDERMTRHEHECSEERREAKKDRHDFRAEVALTLGGMQDRFDDGLSKINASLAGLHGRMNAGLVAMVLVLLGVIGALFWKAAGW
jgi:hypothetical protein